MKGRRRRASPARQVVTEEELLTLAERAVRRVQQEARRSPRAVIFEVLRDYFQWRATVLDVGGSAGTGHLLRALAAWPVVRRARQELFRREGPPFKTWSEAYRWLRRTGGPAWLEVPSEDLQEVRRVRVPVRLRQNVKAVACITGWPEPVAAEHLLTHGGPSGPAVPHWRVRQDLDHLRPEGNVALLSLPVCHLTLWPEALSPQAWAALRVELLHGLARLMRRVRLVVDGQVARLRPPVLSPADETLLYLVLHVGLPQRPGRGRAGAADYWARLTDAFQKATGEPATAGGLRKRWERLCKKMPWVEGLLRAARDEEPVPRFRLSVEVSSDPLHTGPPARPWAKDPQGTT